MDNLLDTKSVPLSEKEEFLRLNEKKEFMKQYVLNRASCRQAALEGYAAAYEALQAWIFIEENAI
jgi:hypothetical protein